MIRRRRRLVVLLAAAALAASAAPAGAVTPGDLDTSFGAAGTGVTALNTGTELYGVAVQTDGQIVAAGDAGSSMVVARFSASGSLESRFVAGSGVGRAVAIQPDGKIVVAGSDSSGMLVERFNRDGTLDAGFGSGGIVHAAAQGRANALALGPAGTIIAAGQLPGSDSFQRVAVLRLGSDGRPDTSVGPGGVDVVDLGQDSVARGVAVQADGKILLAGSQGPGAHQVLNAFAARLTASGALDPSFGASGSGVLLQYPFGGGGAVTFNAVALDPAGGIVVGGGGTGLGPPQAVFARLTCAGAPDPGFAGGGLALVPAARTFIGDPLGVNGIAVAAGRQVVGAGEYQDSGLISASVWGFAASGSPSFATHTPSGGARASALALDQAGNFVVAGTITPAGFASSGFVARYIGVGPPAQGGSPCGGSFSPQPQPQPRPRPQVALSVTTGQSHRTWAETKSVHRKRPVGTTFFFSLNAPARVHFAFTQRVTGRQVHGRCVARTRRNRRNPACNRTVRKGTVVLSGHAGKNNFPFRGRISRSHRLELGRYTVVITATNAAGQQSSPQSLTFTIVR